MQTSSGVMYKLSEVPSMMACAGFEMTDDDSSRWETMVAAELVSKSQHMQRCKRPASAMEEAHVADVPRELPMQPEATQDIDINIRWASVSAANTARQSTSGHAVAAPSQSSEIRNLAEFLSSKGVQQLCALEPSAREAVIVQSENCGDLQQLAKLQAQTIVQANSKAIVWKKSIAMKNQSIRRLREQLVKQKEKQLAQREQSASALDIVRHKGHRLTWKGFVAIGLRKSICLVSASSFPLASLVESSRWTVTRCEVMVWAHVLARHRCFHDYAFALRRCLAQWLRMSGARVDGDRGSGLQLVVHDGAQQNVAEPQLASQDAALHADMGLPCHTEGDQASSAAMTCCGRQGRQVHDGPQTFALAATYWCGDATNSSIWHRQKLQGLEFATCFMVSWKALCANQLSKAFRTWRGMWHGQNELACFFPFVELNDKG